MKVSVRMEGGLGDHFAANRFVPAIKELHPDCSIDLFSDTQGSESQSKILNEMGVKNILTKKNIKIYGNPNLVIKKKIIIKNFLKDHRVFMTSVIAALIFGGDWSIANKDAINTSFPSFLKKIKYLGAKIH